MAEWIARWAVLYADHRLVSIGITYLHLAGLMVGGGTAFVTDRAVRRAWRVGADARDQCLDALARSHRTVVSALVVMTVSGTLMFAADAGTFLHSRLFWTKAALLGLLVANGALLLRRERRLNAADDRGWRRLAVSAGASLLLWLLLLLVGTWLPVGA